MRLSMLVGRTLRQPPADAHLLSHQLLVRAGYVRAVDAGLFAYLKNLRPALNWPSTSAAQATSTKTGMCILGPLTG